MNPTAFPLRRSVYHLLIAVAVAAVCGRILAVGRLYEPWLFRAEDDSTSSLAAWPKARPEPEPHLGSNDRSRWDTVRSLVDDGTYAIGERDKRLVLATAVSPLGAGDGVGAAALVVAGYQLRTTQDRGIITEDGWQTVDKVLHPTELKFYSSKPPLLSTALAGEYWLLKRLFGWSIAGEEDRWWVVRTILLTVNALPLLLYLLLLARLVERLGGTDWGRFFVLAAACFGTFVTTFAVTLNNHTVAACTAVFALYPALRIWTGPPPGWRGAGLFLLAGFFAGLTVSAELPAAAFAGLLFVLLLVRSLWKTLALYVPAAAVPVAALVLTNYLAIGELSPAYAKTDSVWYRYEGSYWQTGSQRKKPGIDWAKEQEGAPAYAFHFLVGHHGVFSLTPVFLLALAGMGLAVRRPAAAALPDAGPPAGNGDEGGGTGKVRAGPGWRPGQGMLALLTAALTVIVLGFYLVKTNNYGGWTSGPRWLIWLTPFWLLTMLPAADWLAGRRWGRALGLALLAISVLSASYPAWNPWRHPWIYNWMEAQGWLPY